MNTPKLITLVFLAIMVLVIVSVDVFYFRDRFWERLIMNVGLVLVFAVVYLRFFR